MKSLSPNPRILVRGVNWLGDAVMTTPALHRLRERFPEAQITLLTRAKLAELWHGHPAINSIITFNSREKPRVVAARIRPANFDLALVLPNSPRSALEAWLARIPRRIGYTSLVRRWLLTDPVPRRHGHLPMRKRSVREIRRLSQAASPPEIREKPGPQAHHIHHYLHLAATLGADPAPVVPTLHVSGAETDAAILKFGLSRTLPVFGLNAGAEYGPAKRWLPDRFVATAVAVQQRIPCQWLILGGASETTLAGEIHAGLTRALTTAWPGLGAERLPLNLSGRTSLRELLAVLKSCRVVLTNDTGPMHLAAALGTPVVVPFGSTSPELTGPGIPGDSRHVILQGRAPCAPCFLRTCPVTFRCMESISVGQATDALLLLANTG